jgi:hypothetical protein
MLGEGMCIITQLINLISHYDFFLKCFSIHSPLIEIFLARCPSVGKVDGKESCGRRIQHNDTNIVAKKPGRMEHIVRKATELSSILQN